MAFRPKTSLAVKLTTLIVASAGIIFIVLKDTVKNNPEINASPGRKPDEENEPGITLVF